MHELAAAESKGGKTSSAVYRSEKDQMKANLVKVKRRCRQNNIANAGKSVVFFHNNLEVKEL
jgi:hypothetical protein